MYYLIVYVRLVIVFFVLSYSGLKIRGHCDQCTGARMDRTNVKVLMMICMH